MSACIRAWRTRPQHRFTRAIKRSGSTLVEPIFCLDNGGKHNVLIARTARSAGALLVTDNIQHFEMIKAFCNVRIISGTEFFNL